MVKPKRLNLTWDDINMTELDLAKQHRLLAVLLRVRNIARVLPKMTNSDELPVPGIAGKKTLKAKAAHRTKPAPDHPWRRPLRAHVDRG